MDKNNVLNSDIIRGHMDAIILNSLMDGDKSFEDFARYIKDKSDGQYELPQSSFYSAAKRLEEKKLLTSYYTSAVGTRRKFFKLTDSGREFFAENFKDWIRSRNIIDKLLSDGGDLGYPEYEPPVRKPRPQPVETDEFDPDSYKGYSFLDEFGPRTDEDEDDDYTEETVVETEPETERYVSPSPVIKTHDDSTPEDRIRAEQNENELDSLDRANADSITQLSLISDTETAEETTEETVEETEQPETVYTYEDEAEPEEPEISEEISGEDDDTLKIEPLTTPASVYEEFLRQFFPSDNFADTVVTQEPRREVVAPPVTAEELPETLTVTSPAAEPEPHEEAAPAPVKNPGDIDYEDIINFARLKGYKIKTADKTNRNVKGKLFINKLVAASAWLLYLLIAAEVAALAFPLFDFISFPIAYYGYFAAGVALFPVIALLVLIIKPQRTVDRLPTMGYCILCSFVVVLNLVLVDFAVVLALKIDLAVMRNLILCVVLPSVFFLNIPLYYIIKYTFLSKKLFYSKESK